MRASHRPGFGRRLATAVATALLAPVFAASAAPAAPTLSAPPCVGYDGDARTLPVQGGGFSPGAYVSVRYEGSYLGEPRSAALLNADASGGFSTTLVPPSPGPIGVESEVFTLSAVDPLRRELFAATTFKVVRVAARARPRASVNPSRRVLYRATGFAPGTTLYLHVHRLGGGDVRTASLGRARGACGTVSKRLPLVPGGDVTPGAWYFAVDAARRYAPTTSPQSGGSILVKRPPPRRGSR